MFLSFRYLSFSHRKTFLKQKSKTDKVHFSCRSGSITEQTVTTDDSSYYQDISVSKDENAYQTLHRHWLELNEPLPWVNFMCIWIFYGIGLWLHCIAEPFYFLLGRSLSFYYSWHSLNGKIFILCLKWAKTKFYINFTHKYM